MSLKGTEMAAFASKLEGALTALGNTGVIDCKVEHDGEISILLDSPEDLNELALKSGKEVAVNDVPKKGFMVRFYEFTADRVTYTTNEQFPIAAPEAQENVPL